MSLVEDGAYPNAAQILAEQDITLVAGDGHIVLADCTGTGSMIELYRRPDYTRPELSSHVCFAVSGSAGRLTVEIVDVYNIKADSHPLKATLDTDGDLEVVDVAANQWEPVGEGSIPGTSSTLLELRVGSGLAPVTGAEAAIGKLAAAERSCTATLIAPRWVVTAASCFADQVQVPTLAEGVPARASSVVFPGHAATAIDWISPRADRDAVLARLAAPVTDITPLALAPTAAPTGTNLDTFGYVRSGTGWTSDVQQAAQVNFDTAAAGTLTAATGAQLCKGMAGAPVLASGKVAAVLSQAGQSGCPDTTSTDSSITAARTDDFGTWANLVTSATAAHTWTLADMPAAGSGTAVAATADNVFTGAGAPLTGAAGTTWATGDTYSPAVEFNGTSGQLTSAGPAVNTTADFTISARVKPTAAGGVVLSQDGTQAAGFKLYTDAATMSWRFAMSSADSTSATWVTAAAPDNSVQLNQWALITIAFKATGGLMTLDIDGINQAVIGNTGTKWNATGGLRFGAVKTGASTVGAWYAGRLATVQSWNKATTAFRSPAANSTVVNARTGNTEVYFNSGGTLKVVRFDGTNWSAAESLGATTQGIPTAIVNPVNNNIQVYYVSGGNLTEKSFDGTTWTTTSFGVAASGQPAVLFNPKTKMIGVYFNSGNVLKSRHWTPSGGWAAVASLTTAIAGSPTAVYNPKLGNMQLYFNSGGVLYEKWFNGTAWGTSNMSTAITGQPSALYNPQLGNIQVYVNAGGTLSERFWNPTTGWSGGLGNLGVTMTGSPAAIYNPTIGNIQVYANSGGLLKEKWWQPSGVWAGPSTLSTPTTNSPWVIFNPVTSGIEVYVNSGGNLSLKAWDPVASWAAVRSLGAPITN
ncbi:trypsin-like serine protease [Catellatospora sp. KI3]|uniref:trypsin-like serine protease n=1 Tax=Catellatospora sp. KI3 TaxID=3041620 RepID=UPI002483067B|nr:trypsin-like serine protease [Catellatospora sp. KI3]MDI1462182.1 trypsin-like serine protease [Catellatospora sp. KI3]